MSAPPQSAVRNRLLASFPSEDYARLRPHLAPVELPLRAALIEPDRPVERAVFPERGIASVVAVAGQHRIEVGLIGREGFTGMPLLLGTRQLPMECFIQMSGEGWQVPAAVLQAATEDCPALRTPLLRFVQAFAVQVAQTALSNGSHTLEERLARWLLMCHDRADGDVLFTTHEFLATMLGVRRPGITEALHVLEGDRAIRAERGIVTILDRAKLERVAGDSYGLAEREYSRLVERSTGSEAVGH
jgi:CRP-like cAMP-binding protein